MCPYVNIFGNQIPAYSITLVIGILFAVLYFETGSRKQFSKICDTEAVFMLSGVGAAIGAKLLFLMTCIGELICEFSYLVTNTSAFLEKYVFAGFVFYGGLYGAIASVWIYAYFKKQDVDGILQCMLPVFPLIHGFGRIGCFMMGCCYGSLALHSFFGVEYPQGSFAPCGFELIPVQLYEAAAEFVLFFVLAWMAEKKLFTGRTMLGLYLIAYSVVRFVLEFFRGDVYRGFIGPLSLSQWISMVTLLFGYALFLRNYSKKSVESHSFSDRS